MAHYVICKICGEKFDRDIYEAVKVGSRRYAHKSCVELHPETKDVTVAERPEKTLENINKKMVLTEDQEKITINMSTGAVTAESKKILEEQKEAENLVMLKDTINSIFGSYCNWSMTMRQINSYKKKYGYSYTGMARTLIYYYEKLGNDPRSSNGSVGIIPYIYDKAYDYYYNVWLRQQQNMENNLTYKHLSTEETKTIDIIKPISEPIKIEMRKPHFNFLEEDNIEED